VTYSTRKKAKWAGVDGCRRGWVVAVVNGKGSVVHVKVYRTFAEILVEGAAAKLTLTDIPIGLPSRKQPRGRSCDQKARDLLKRRASTVFPVPAREAVWASSYEEACQKNHDILKKRLSKQSWAICSKIREVDATFRLIPRLQRRFRETHPELCFRLLDNGEPVQTPKRTSDGRKIRRGLLHRCLGNVTEAIQETKERYPSSWVKEEDVLDALAAAVVARMTTEQRVCSLNATPERDACGLTMEMVGIERQRTSYFPSQNSPF